MSALRTLAIVLVLVLGAAGRAHGQPYDFLYEHWVGFDEDSRNVTFLGRGVLMLAEIGPAHPREVRVFSAQTGRALRTLACPPIDYTRDDLSYWCPMAIAATGRFYVLQADEQLRVYARSGDLLADIVPPDATPPYSPGFAGGFAIRGRRLAQGGPAYEGGLRAPGVVVYLFDAASGALLDRHHVAAPDDHTIESLAFAGRALVVRLRRHGPSPQPSVLVAIDARTGAPIWRRDAATPEGRAFGPGLIGLGSEVMVGRDRLDAHDGDLLRTYVPPDASPTGGLRRVAAAGRRVAVADGSSSVHLFSADGTFLETVPPPYELCDLFGETVGLTASRLLVTSDSYCGGGHAFVFRLR